MADAAGQKQRGRARMRRDMDILNGPLARNIFIFALPLALSSILQQFFNSADVAVVGNFADSLALAAVGVNAENVGIYINFVVGASVGPNVLAAKMLGSKQDEKLSRAVHTTMALSILIGLIVFVVGEMLAPPLLRWTEAPADVYPQALLYLRVFLVGLPFLTIFNFATALMRSKGETRLPLLYMVISGVVNIVLNLGLVLAGKNPVLSVAVASVLANVLSAGLSVAWLMRQTNALHFDPRKMVLEGPSVKEILVLGLPAGVQSMVFSISNVLVQAGINTFGVDVIAGSSVELNFEYFTYYFAIAFAQAAITFYAQNYAAGNKERCRRVLIVSMVEGVVVSQAVGWIFLIFNQPFLRFYTADPNVMHYAYQRLVLSQSIEGVCAIFEIAAAIMRVRGWPITPSAIMIAGTVVFRMVWVFFIFPLHPTYEFLVLIYPVSWIVTDIAQLIALRLCLMRTQKPALGQARA